MQRSWLGAGIETQCLHSLRDFCSSRLRVECSRKTRLSDGKSSGMGIPQPDENTGRVLDWNHSRTLRLTAPVGVK